MYIEKFNTFYYRIVFLINYVFIKNFFFINLKEYLVNIYFKR